MIEEEKKELELEQENDGDEECGDVVLAKEDFVSTDGKTFTVAKYNATLVVEPSEKSLTADEVVDAFMWFATNHLCDEEFKDSSIRVSFDTQRKEPSDLDGFTKETDKEGSLLTWINPNKDKETQLLTFFHEMVHILYALDESRGDDDNGDDDDDEYEAEEDDAYEHERDLLEAYKDSKK